MSASCDPEGSTPENPFTLHIGESRIFDIDEQHNLAGALQLTGTPTVTTETIEGGGALTLSDPATSGTRAQVRVAGGVAGGLYRVKFTMTDTATPSGNVIVDCMYIRAEAC